MRRKHTRRDNRIFIYAAAAVVLFLIAFFAARTILAADGARPGKITDAQLSEGRSYLERLESSPASEVEESIRELHRQKLIGERDAALEELEANPDSVWSDFHDYVILGDSRAVSFSYLKFLPEDHVLADTSANIRAMADHYDEIAALNPSYIISSFGINDIGIGFWPTPESYAEEYLECAQALQELVPGVKVFIVATMPVIEPGLSLNDRWLEVDDYNAALEQMCSENNGLYYVDGTDIVEGHPELYQSDGIHFHEGVYTPWAVDMITAIYNAETEEAVEAVDTE